MTNLRSPRYIVIRSAGEFPEPFFFFFGPRSDLQAAGLTELMNTSRFVQPTNCSDVSPKPVSNVTASFIRTLFTED